MNIEIDYKGFTIGFKKQEDQKFTDKLKDAIDEKITISMPDEHKGGYGVRKSNVLDSILKELKP